MLGSRAQGIGLCWDCDAGNASQVLLQLVCEPEGYSRRELVYEPEGHSRRELV